MGPRGLLARLDRQKWSGLAIDKVVGVTPRGWFSRQEMPALKQAVGVAPLGGTMDAAIVERQNTGGWVVGHELAHQLGWTEEAGPHGNHLEAAPAPGYWADGRKEHPRDDARLHALLDRRRGRAAHHGPLDLQGDLGLPRRPSSPPPRWARPPSRGSRPPRTRARRCR